ncbi:unnamed protein product [Didymodactylos carnosus]|uniref:Uncharacterized protein n=1 Tax=Didymodactylos carnosus TaxID=1234261 RepID=A0A815JF54_9BILA|nr:unnamed protein product [Didymodactylos carnosus]CAF4276179.1 unnamed protein product [Didymodactylos carnosus]
MPVGCVAKIVPPHDLNESSNNEFIKQYSKIRGSFIGHNIILAKLRQDLHLLSSIPLRQPFSVNTTRTETRIHFYKNSQQYYSLRELTEEQRNFASFQLFINVILSESNETNCFLNKAKALKLYKMLSLNDNTTVKIISEFEDMYSSDNAIDFFLENIPIKESLNKALRTEDVQQICVFWFFINDLYKQLSSPYTRKPLIVYSGHYVTIDELENLKSSISSFVSFKTFFSTYTSSIRALRRSGRGQGRPYLESVLFEIKLRSSITKTRFAKVSSNKEEEMFLFSPGSVFRLESIEKLNGQVWYCKLSVNDEDECALNKLFVHLENEVGRAATFVTIGVYLSALGKNDTAVTYYRTLLMESTDPDTNATIHNNYAIVYDQKNDQTNASFELKKAQQMYTPNDNESTHQKADTSSNVSERSVLSNSPILSHHNLVCVNFSDGQFVSTNGFLSTTIDQTVAKFFAGDGQLRSVSVDVLFKLKIDYSTPCRPYTVIPSGQGCMTDEEEILFTIGSVWRIKSVIPGNK